MKVKIATLTAVLALVVVGSVRAQAPASSGTRIAVVNIAEFLRNYERAKESGEYLTQQREFYLKQVQGLREEMNSLQEKVRTGGSKEDAEMRVTEIQRQIQDIDRDAQRKITKVADDSVVAIHKEVRYFVSQVAKAQGYDLVFCYPGAVDEEELGQAVVARMNLQTPAAMPFFINPSIDITANVTETANKWYRDSKAKRSGESTAPAGN